MNDAGNVIGEYECWGPYDLWDPLRRYQYRGFRVGPGEVVIIRSNDAEVYINRVGVATVAKQNLAPILAAIDRGEWLEMPWEEMRTFVDFARKRDYVSDAASRAAAAASRVEGKFKADMATQDIPVTPAENRSRIRQVMRTWRGHDPAFTRRREDRS